MAVNWSHWLSWLPFVGKLGAQGASLPGREFPLKLELPPQQPRSRRNRTKLEAPPYSWRELHNYPTELLREVARYLNRVNTERVSAEKRRQWLEQALQYACPAIRKIYSLHYKEDALPESNDRREGLVAAINACTQLATGYKHQLMLDFALSDSRYALVRDRVRGHAVRILELIRMEQRLRAMRYQKLPSKTWLDCNRLFFALAQCEDIKALYDALPCLQLFLDRRPDSLERRPPTKTSIQQVFLTIQLYGLIDTNTISTRKMHIVDMQITQALEALALAPDRGGQLSPGQIIVYSNQDCPALFERKDEVYRQKQVDDETGVERDILRAITIDISPLEQSLTEEHKKLLQRFEHPVLAEGEEAAANAKANIITDQDDMIRLLTVDAMCDRLHLKRRQEEREYIIGQKILYVYNSFMSVYKLLVDMAAEEAALNPDLVTDNDLRDALAGRSALIAADLEASEFGQWFILDKSEGGVHIKTRESQFTTAMFIGQLLAFAFSRDELKDPTLGYVVRLSRATAGEIEVTIRILSKQARATAVQSEFLSKNDMALPAILLQDGGVRLAEKAAQDSSARSSTEALVLHTSHRLSPETAVQVEVDQGHKNGCIGDLLLMQREFVIYDLLPEAASTTTAGKN
jgi:hypothetical protein